MKYMHEETMQKRSAVAYLWILMFLSGFIFITGAFSQVAQPGDRGFNYAEALQKTILFYEAQRSGKITGVEIPTRFTWRGDSQLTDGQAEGLDLTGGWVDAGDNMKYGFPMAAAVAVLAWGVNAYKEGYKQTGQYQWVLNQLKWANDYFIKAHPSANVLYAQVGVTDSDHGLWIPIESTHLYTDRTAYKLDTTHPGTETAAQTAAAMAASAMLFMETDSTYAAILLRHARELYSFADNYRGNIQDSIPDPDAYKSWSGYNDELVWGAIWLYKATGETVYRDKAVEYYALIGKEENTTYNKYSWTFCWDDMTHACYVLMAEIFPDNSSYQQDVERWLDFWTIGFNGKQVPYTPGGHARLDDWGSLRYAANTALGAFIYADRITDTTKKVRYRDFAETQINYILGDNPKQGSFLCGFGVNPPQHPHHRTAHGSWGRRMENPPEHRHILYGALVGSPTLADVHNDLINDYVANEVALDYNAGLAGCLAKMALLYSGTPIPDSQFPLPDKPYTARDEWAVFALTYSDAAHGVLVSANLENRTSWPARPSDKLKFRYFFTLDAPDISDISVSKCSGPLVWDEAKKVYYVEIDLTGQWIAPGYAWDSGGPLIDFTISSKAGSWSSANDWSFAGWDGTYTSGSRKYAPNIPIYEGSTLLSGAEPEGGSTPVYAIGDVNHSGTVDVNDALLIARYSAGLPLSVFYTEQADVNADGSINVLDALVVARRAAGL